MSQKGFSQEESDSSNLLLSLMKRIEDVRILKFISLVKLLIPNNKTRTIIFRISELIAIEVIEKNILLIRNTLAEHKKVIAVFCFEGTRAPWVQCILKIIFKFTFSEMAETNMKTCQ